MANPTLVINRFDSHCGNCRGPVNPFDKQCTVLVGYETTNSQPGCGVVWTQMDSDYSGMKDNLVKMRPDLKWIGID